MEEILVTRPSMPSYEEYIEEIKSIWETKWLTNMGPKHQELTEKLKQYLNVNRLSLFTNGHTSIELGLQALNIKGEVITTPFTFASTTHAIVRNGLTPVFCDINPVDFTMDVSKIEKLITDKTSAIMPVHVYGNICDVNEIQRIADKYGLKVIYDAAHTFGEIYNNRSVVDYGDVSMLSFHATKVFNTIEGGAVCFHDEEYGDKLRKLKDFGIKSAEVVDGIGANAKMNEFQAAMGLCNLRHVDDEISKRKSLVEAYRHLLNSIDGLYICPEQQNLKSNYAYFPIVIDESKYGFSRNELHRVLQENKVYARKYFYPLTNSFDCYFGRFNDNMTPVALHISKRVLTLPLYADLKVENVERICDIIRKLKK